MKPQCPSKSLLCLESGRMVGHGSYYRISDRKRIQRYKCALCGQHFSQATNKACYGQNKRQLNSKIFRLYVSGVSQNRMAQILNTKQATISKKLEFLGLEARKFNYKFRQQFTNIQEVQFDDLETFEHTKLKPLSVPLMVEKHSRFILGFEVARMPAKGHLAKKSRKKYGPRKNETKEARDRLFRRIQRHIAPNATIESDQNPHYPRLVQTYFPGAQYITHKGQRGAVTGQGELKKIDFDPLFSLNHTCAMFRANINRLIRKTWCTTKKIQPLIDHIELYVMAHNQYLIQKLRLSKSRMAF